MFFLTAPHPRQFKIPLWIIDDLAWDLELLDVCSL